MKTMIIDGQPIRHFEDGDKTNNGVATGEVRIDSEGLREYMFEKNGSRRWMHQGDVSIPGQEEWEASMTLGQDPGWRNRAPGEDIIDVERRREAILHQAIAEGRI